MEKYCVKIFSILCMTLLISGNIKSSDVEIDEQDQDNNQTQMMSNSEDDQQIEHNNKSNNKLKKKRNKKRTMKKSGLKKKRNKKRTMKKKRKVLHTEGTFDENGNSSNGLVTYSNGMSEKGEFKENKLYNGEKKYPSSIKITDGKKENIKYDDRTIKLNSAR